MEDTCCKCLGGKKKKAPEHEHLEATFTDTPHLPYLGWPLGKKVGALWGISKTMFDNVGSSDDVTLQDSLREERAVL